MPWSARQSRYILTTEIKGNNPMTQHTENLYFRDGQRIISVVESFPERGEVQGLTLLEFDAAFHLTRRVEAVSARHLDGGAGCCRGTERTFDPATQQIISFNRQRELPWTWPTSRGNDGDLVQTGGNDVPGTAPPGRPHAPVRAGFQPLPGGVATAPGPLRHPMLMVLLGVPFALHRGRKASLGLGIAVSLATFLAYFALQAIGMAFGTAGLLPLPLAAWSANLLLLLVGAWLFLTLDN